MRSEERSGIVFIILLFVWGTPLSSPIRIVTGLFSEAVTKIINGIGLSMDVKLGSILYVLLFLGITILFLLLSRTIITRYLPIFLTIIPLIYYLVGFIKQRSFDFKIILPLLIALSLLGIIYLLPFKTIGLFIEDIYILSFPCVILVESLMLPLSSLNSTIDKILYIDRYQIYNLTIPFGKFLYLPGIVWGLFIMIIFSLPTIYYSYGRRKE